MLNEIKAYLGIAVANRGQLQEAETIFREVRPFLEARKDNELLERCRVSVVGQARARV